MHFNRKAKFGKGFVCKSLLGQMEYSLDNPS